MKGRRTIHILIIIGILVVVVAAHGVLYYALSHAVAMPLAVLLGVLLLIVIRHLGLSRRLLSVLRRGTGRKT